MNSPIADNLKRATALVAAGKLDEAEALMRQVAAENPGLAIVHNELGIVMERRGRLAEAADCYRRAARIDPRYALAHANLGSALRRLGRAGEAAAELRGAIALGPGTARWHNQLGLALLDLGHNAEAATELLAAVELQGDHFASLVNCCVALRRVGRLDEAEAMARRAIAANGESALGYNALGLSLQLKHRMPEAAEALRGALARDAIFFDALVNLGNVLCHLDDYDAAIDCYRKAVERKPGAPEPLNNLASALKDVGRTAEALAVYQRAMALAPGFAAAGSGYVQSLAYEPATTGAQLLAAHREWSARHADALTAAAPPCRNDADAGRALRVGYVSPDFRRHSVAYFIEPLLAHHDRARFVVHCYSDVVRPDETTARLRAHADVWRDVAGLSDEQLAGRIREDQVDILVDLAGHTNGNRLLTFARKAAPVQMTYLGYPTTTGLAAMDWRVSDATVDPPGISDAQQSERALRLGRCFVCYRAPLHAPAVRERDAGRAFTFGSFNNFAKVNDAVLDAWGEILRATPGARLLVKSQGLSSEAVRGRVREALAQRGVDGGRIELRGREPVAASHLDLYHEVDVALDTFPYNGTTTTCEAMWMGTPVVSLRGGTSPARVGASLLEAVGLGECVGGSVEEYVRIAARLAGDVGRVREMQRSLRERMRGSSLMDGRGFADAMERAYLKAWADYCARRGAAR